MKITFYNETCCEICNEIIHNHMVCPVCKNEYAGIDVYSDMSDLTTGDTIQCEECGATFKLLENNEWEKI